MSKKNIFLLAAGYVAWGIVASLFNKKKPSDLKKELQKSKEDWEGEFRVFVDNFILTHKNLFDTFKTELLSEKNKKAFQEKKTELLQVVDVYKAQWEELLEELKGKWKVFLSEASDNLDKLYQEKKVEIDALKEVAPEKVKSLKDNLLAAYEELKTEATKKMKK